MLRINKEDIIIIPAGDISTKLLLDFYQVVFPERFESLKYNWNWLNRSDFYDNKIPLVVFYENRVIAHSGMIPFKFAFENEIYSASWFIDFKILNEFQRLGLGSKLTNEWMSFSDCSFTFCNEKSIGVFKKFGWVESFDTYMHLHFMFAFDHPGFVRRLPLFLRKFLNQVSYFFYYWIYIKFSYSKENYKVEPYTDILFDDFYSTYLNKIKLNSLDFNFRDIEYVRWRILNSPNKQYYHIYSANDFKSIVSIQNNHGKYIDILWVSDLSNEFEITKMIASLGIYGLQRGYAYLRFFTNNRKMSVSIKYKLKSWVSHPRFAFYSKNTSLFQKLKNVQWNFELIDSDFEHFK